MQEIYDWSGGEAYERYIGRWSSPVAHEFLRWLALPAGLDWFDLGCGTGALSEALLQDAEPRSLRAYDLSPEYASVARDRLRDPRVFVGEADARSVPEGAAGFDVVVSGLMLNFVPEPRDALAEMRRLARPGATVAAYLWDYAEGMTLLRRFWDAAVELDPAAAELDEGPRFPLCRPEPLRDLFMAAGLAGVEVQPIDVVARFSSFDDYWWPFTGGQGPAPGYLATLDDGHRDALRRLLRTRLPREGAFDLTCRAWAVRGTIA